MNFNYKYFNSVFVFKIFFDINYYYLLYTYIILFNHIKIFCFFFVLYLFFHPITIFRGWWRQKVNQPSKNVLLIDFQKHLHTHTQIPQFQWMIISFSPHIDPYWLNINSKIIHFLIYICVCVCVCIKKKNPKSVNNDTYFRYKLIFSHEFRCLFIPTTTTTKEETKYPLRIYFCLTNVDISAYSLNINVLSAI